MAKRRRFRAGRPSLLAAAIALALAQGAAAQPQVSAREGEAAADPNSAAPSRSQEPEPAEAPQAERPAPAAIEEILIKGTRVDATDVQDQAEAITAFSMEDLDRADIINVDNLAFAVPNLHVGQQGQQAIITLRGIGTENATVTGEPGVAFHVDGVNYGRPAAARVSFFDLEALQVLRGPQGTKGGKNSTAGWINVITRKPHDEYEAQSEILYGSYGRVLARGALNLPLGEYAAARGAFVYENRDGYLEDLTFESDDRDGFDADTFGFRNHLRLNPTDTVELLFTYHHYREKGNGPQADLVPLDTFCNGGFRFPPFESFHTSLPRGVGCRWITTLGDPDRGKRDPATLETEDTDPREIFTTDGSAQDNRYWGFNTTAIWDVPRLPRLGETQLKWIAGFQSTELGFRQDFDGTALDLVPVDTDSETLLHAHELQWTGAAGEWLDWQLSLLFQRETSEAHADVDAQLLSPITTDNSTENKAYGAALHTDWHLGQDLTLSLGARYTKDKKSTTLLRDNTIRSVFGAQLIGCDGGVRDVRAPLGVPDNGVPTCTRVDRHVTGGATLEYWPTQENLVYASANHGFKSGGFNIATAGTYDPELIWAYALGTKNRFFDERLIVNIEGFYYDYSDLQLVMLDGVSFRIENADARVWGTELELVAMPVEGLRLNANLSYLNTEIRDFQTLDPAALDVFEGNRLLQRSIAELVRDAAPFEERDCPFPDENGVIRSAPCTVDDFSGNVLPRAPEWSLTLAAEYAIPLGDWGTLTPRVQYYWQDETYFRPFNRDFDLQEAFHKTDLKLIWTSPSELLEAEVFVDNIEDEAVVQNLLIGSRVFGSPPFAWYGDPRTYGVRLRFHY